MANKTKFLPDESLTAVGETDKDDIVRLVCNNKLSRAKWNVERKSKITRYEKCRGYCVGAAGQGSWVGISGEVIPCPGMRKQECQEKWRHLCYLKKRKAVSLWYKLHRLIHTTIQRGIQVAERSRNHAGFWSKELEFKPECDREPWIPPPHLGVTQTVLHL